MRELRGKYSCVKYYKGWRLGPVVMSLLASKVEGLSRATTWPDPNSIWASMANVIRSLC